MTITQNNNTVGSYLFPAVARNLTTKIDRQSMRSIRNLSLAVCIFELLAIVISMSMEGWRFEGKTLASFCTMGFCAVFSLPVFFISRNMMKDKQLSHGDSVAVKVVFFAVYSLWGIYADMRHYTGGEQMLTFYTVQLLAACFIMFEPWIGILLVSAAYTGLYAAAYSVHQAKGIDTFNFVLMALLSAVGMCIQYHNRLYLARKEERLNTASHRDALTGLRNRLSLEEDTKKICGKPIAVYMIDIDFFKEINDQYGHICGDEILKETGSILKNLYPEARWYRYGGDEFLVLSSSESSRNYTGSEFHFEKQTTKGKCKVSLSIGMAGGVPQSNEELFTLISRADEVLYAGKARVHALEYDRRRKMAGA